jgi:ABC-type glycerol-3-phosphate transport system substrate-binding protein
LNDDDYAAQWAAGNVAAGAFYAGWMQAYWDTAIAQGLIEAPFRVRYVPFPHAPGVTRVPTAWSGGATLATASNDARRNAIVARFVYLCNDEVFQGANCPLNAVYPTITGLNVNLESNPYYMQIQEIVRNNGTFDLGLTTTTYSEVRVEMFPLMQAVLRGDITPAQCIAQYEATVNRILAQ